MSRLAALMHDDALARMRSVKADGDPREARLASTTTDRSSSTLSAAMRMAAWIRPRPSILRWPGGAGGLALPRAEAMLNRWASAEFSTDWGTRDVSIRTPLYDPSAITRARSGRCSPVGCRWPNIAPGGRFRIRAPDAERGSHLGAGSGRSDRTALRRILSAAGTQQLAPDLVIRDGGDTCHARFIRSGLGRAAPQCCGSRRICRQAGIAHSFATYRWAIRRIDLEFTRENGRLIVKARSVLRRWLLGLAAGRRRGEPYRRGPSTRCPCRFRQGRKFSRFTASGVSAGQLKVVGEHGETIDGAAAGSAGRVGV